MPKHLPSLFVVVPVLVIVLAFVFVFVIVLHNIVAVVHILLVFLCVCLGFVLAGICFGWLGIPPKCNSPRAIRGFYTFLQDLSFSFLFVFLTSGPSCFFFVFFLWLLFFFVFFYLSSWYFSPFHPQSSLIPFSLPTPFFSVFLPFFLSFLEEKHAML